MAALRPALFLALIAATLAHPTSAASDSEIWVGPAQERDDYNDGTTLNTIHEHCQSTVGVATLIHLEGTWQFYTFNDNCVGFDYDFPEGQCTTDGEGVMTCTDTPAPPGISVSLVFTPEGHVTVDFVGGGPFAGGHYHIEGDLNRL